MNNEHKDNSNETFQLKWQGGLNVIEFNEFFSELRESEELFDVNLGCLAYGGSTTPLKAHKTLLAAYSDIFRDMFLQMDDKMNPFIFIKGISKENLIHLLDFIYDGSVNISKSNIKSFLDDAKELNIKGLNFDDVSQSENNISSNQGNKSFPNKSNKQILREDALPQKDAIDFIFNDREQEETKIEHTSIPIEKVKTKVEVCKRPNKVFPESIKGFINDQGKYYLSGKQKRPIVECKICAKENRQKEYQKEYIEKHIVTQHSSYLPQDSEDIDQINDHLEGIKQNELEIDEINVYDQVVAMFDKTGEYVTSPSGKKRYLVKCKMCSKQIQSQTRVMSSHVKNCESTKTKINYDEWKKYN